MNNFAAVAPLGIQEELAVRGKLGNYQLLIASIVLERQEAYSEFYLYSDHFIIMDNGVIELGYPLDPRDLVRAVATVGAQVVVMPDTIDDAKMTVKQVRSSLEVYRKLDSVTQTLGVVQGRTFTECMWCAERLVEAGVDWLSIPRGLTPNLGSRVALVKEVADAFAKPMHILGFSENIQDDIEAAAASVMVKGIDAATPVWLGMSPRREYLPVHPPRRAGFGRRPTDYWQRDSGTDMFIIESNVVKVRNWLARAAMDAHTRRAEPAVVMDL